MANNMVGIDYAHPGVALQFPAAPQVLSEAKEQLKQLALACQQAEDHIASLVPKVQLLLDKELGCAFTVGDKLMGRFQGAKAHEFVKCTLLGINADGKFRVEYNETLHTVKQGDIQVLKCNRKESGSPYVRGTFQWLKRGVQGSGNRSSAFKSKVQQLRAHLQALKRGELPERQQKRLQEQASLRGAFSNRISAHVRPAMPLRLLLSGLSAVIA